MSVISKKLKKDVNSNAAGDPNPSEKKIETKYGDGEYTYGIIGDILNFFTSPNISFWLKGFVVLFIISLVILWQGTPAVVNYFFSVDKYLADQEYKRQSRDIKRTELLENLLLNRSKSTSKSRNFTRWKSGFNLEVKKHGWTRGKRSRPSTDVTSRADDVRCSAWKGYIDKELCKHGK